MLDSFLSMVGCKHMINTKARTTNNIYTNVNKCEMRIANLYVMARGERIFEQLHVSRGTPYNVYTKQLLNRFSIAIRKQFQGTPENV